jgi:hypothetical protein
MVAGLVAVAVVLAAALVAAVIGGRTTPLEDGLKALPKATRTANFTDWSVMRERLDASAVGSSAQSADKQRLFDKAYDADYTAISLLALIEAEMADNYGWSVLDADWEMFGQSELGAVDVLDMGDGFDFEAADDRLTALGYPAGDELGVRAGGSDLVAQIDSSLTPTLAHVALLSDEGMVVLSDSQGYAQLAVEVIRGDEPSAYDVDGASELAGRLSGLATGVVHLGDRGCEVAGFDRADEQDLELARERVDAAGGVHEHDGFAMGMVGDDFVVPMYYGSGDPSSDLDARAALAVGEAPLQGGTFEERFTVQRVEASGDELVLTLEPTEPDAQLLSDFGQGGILFATCPL